MRGSTLFVGRVDGRTLVRITGELDAAYAPQLADVLALVEGPLVIDCSRLEFIDGTGLRVLAEAVASHGGVTLRSPSPFMVRVAELAEWKDVFVIEGVPGEEPQDSAASARTARRVTGE
jgi:anti-anti-sigma factor